MLVATTFRANFTELRRQAASHQTPTFFPPIPTNGRIGSGSLGSLTTTTEAPSDAFPDLRTRRGDILDEADTRLRASGAGSGCLRPISLISDRTSSDLIRRLPAFDARRGKIGVFAVWFCATMRLGSPLGALGTDGEPPDRFFPSTIPTAQDAASPTGFPRRTVSRPGTATASLSKQSSKLASTWHARWPRSTGAIGSSAPRPANAAVTASPRSAFCSRATIYRRLRDLRCALAAHGARAA